MSKYIRKFSCKSFKTDTYTLWE